MSDFFEFRICGFWISFTPKQCRMTIPTMAGLAAEGGKPEILFWVGCAGSFDQRAQRITKAFASILTKNRYILRYTW